MPIPMYGHVTVLWTVRGGRGWNGGTFDAKYLKYSTVRYIIVRYSIGEYLYGPAPIYHRPNLERACKGRLPLVIIKINIHLEL